MQKAQSDFSVVQPVLCADLPRMEPQKHERGRENPLCGTTRSSPASWSSIIEIIVQTIRVETPSAKYDVFAGSGLLETLAPRIERAVGPAAAARVCGDVAGDLGAVVKKFLRSFR